MRADPEPRASATTVSAVHEHHTLPIPLLRGWTHLISFPLMLICGIALIVLPHTSVRDRIALAIYVGGTATMFGVSAIYHRGRWRPVSRSG